MVLSQVPEGGFCTVYRCGDLIDPCTGWDSDVNMIAVQLSVFFWYLRQLEGREPASQAASIFSPPAPAGPPPPPTEMKLGYLHQGQSAKLSFEGFERKWLHLLYAILVQTMPLQNNFKPISWWEESFLEEGKLGGWTGIPLWFAGFWYLCIFIRMCLFLDKHIFIIYYFFLYLRIHEQSQPEIRFCQ